LPLNGDSLVIILGGYLGESGFRFSSKFGCRILIVEPIPKFVNELEAKFEGEHKVEILSKAVSDRNGYISLFLDGEKTSSITKADTKVEVPVMDICLLVSDQNQPVDLIEFNIEGGEYVCLEALIESGLISTIKILQIQFHDFSQSSELNRAQIRENLRLTHNLRFNYDWVWERWELKHS
jgi:FkbM family methyltransferase